MAKKDEYISLKEAAKMSGYSPDYVGQLIRAGKLSGKQVFSNVAWVTTEEAILEYIQKSKKGGVEAEDTFSKKFKDLLSEKNVLHVYAISLWGTAVLLGFVILFLMYVFVVSIDHEIEQSYLENIPHAKAK